MFIVNLNSFLRHSLSVCFLPSRIDLSVIFNPVGDDLFSPFSIAPIHPCPSLLASASNDLMMSTTLSFEKHSSITACLKVKLYNQGLYWKFIKPM
uniref:Uncharacterized protein n=1 Tax=Rhizophora mucronata TaxID=61149 RepID=A0A2P2KW62_RHIMU